MNPIVILSLIGIGAMVLTRKKKPPPEAVVSEAPPSAGPVIEPETQLAADCHDPGMSAETAADVAEVLRGIAAASSDPSVLVNMAKVNELLVALTQGGFTKAASCLMAAIGAIAVPPGPPAPSPVPLVPKPMPGPVVPIPAPPFIPGPQAIPFEPFKVPPFFTPGPGGHAPLFLRPGDNPNDLLIYYAGAGKPGFGGKMEHFGKLNQFLALGGGDVSWDDAVAMGSGVLLPNTWQPYMQPYPKPGTLEATSPPEWPPLPPAPPVPGVDPL